MRDYDRILEELGWPAIYMVSPRHFEQIDGDNMKAGGGCDGISNAEHRIIALDPHLRGRERRNTIYHEIAHVLFPHRPHWWIEAFACRMAQGGGTGQWCRQSGHAPDELPPRATLLKLARNASARLNERVGAAKT